jgi:hypothetical protein
MSKVKQGGKPRSKVDSKSQGGDEQITKTMENEDSSLAGSES